LSNQRKQQPEKISADCPHCGFSQLESAYAKSTICRRCSQPFSIEKLLAKEVSSLKPPSFFEKVSKLISRETIREISCFSCQATQQVSSAAESSLCPKCGSYIDLRDFKITGPFGRSIQTQGEVYIGKKGDATSQRILCGNALIEGKLRGQLLSTGSVHLKTEGKIAGSIDAESIVIEKKSDTEFVKPLKARSVEINGKITANVFCDGRVTINKHGNLTGVVHARSIVVEKGGIFSGELHIGSVPDEQPALLPDPEPTPEDLPKMPVAPVEPPAAPKSTAATPAHLPGFEPAPPRRPGSGKGPIRRVGAK
jgi:cytoskeletal protein CcmA (bactofilin family)